MADSFYEEIKSTVDSLLAEFGQIIGLKKIPPGAYNANTLTATPGAPVTVNMKGVVLDYTSKYIDGENIKEGDVLVYLSPKNVTAEPEPDDTLIIQGRPYKCVKVIKLQPSGVNVLYEIQARRP